MKRLFGMCATLVWLLSCSTDQKKTGDTVTCTDEDLAVGCVAGSCRLSGPRGTLGSDKKLTLSRIPLPAELDGDAIGSSVCVVTLPPDRENAADLNLQISMTADVKADSALFEHITTGAPDGLVIASSAVGARDIGGLIRHSGTYGATRRPGPWGIDAIAGIDTSGSSDAASLLRNISSKSIYAAYFDGTRLYVGSGNRLLIWNQMPKDSLVKPDVVLGQPDLDSNVQATSSAIWYRSGVTAIWSDGTKLLATAGNRVLIWNAVPTTSGAPADLVLGQPDFASDTANTGGVSAESMSEPWAIDSDGTRVVVGDMRNNRLLTWSSFPTTVGQPATGVIGQPNFTTNTANAGATSIYQTFGALLEGPGAFVSGLYVGGVFHLSGLGVNPSPDFSLLTTNLKVRPDTSYHSAGLGRTSSGLAVRDLWGNRVAMFTSLPNAPATMDFTLGQPDTRRSVWSPLSAASFSPDYHYGLSAHQNVVLVPDANRVLIFEKQSYNFQPATRVIGQAGFSTNLVGADYRGISMRALGAPADVAVSGSTVAVADSGNNRVLLFDAADINSANASATVVLGQPDGASYIARGGDSGLSGPSGVAVDGAHVVVADTENHRVLVWNKSAKAGAPADLVLGQSDFTGRSPNRGRDDVSPKDGFSDADADGFFYPIGVATDGTHLAVADRLNHRVLVWKSWPTQNGQTADAVIGQASFTEVRANRGNGPFTSVPDGLNLPLGVTIAGSSLWIADTENNRVVRYDDAFTVPAAAAFAGQPDGSTVSNPNVADANAYNAGSQQAQPTTAGSVLRPRSVAVAGGRIFVSETTSNRVHVFDANLASVGVLGQSSSTTSGPNANGLGPSSVWFPLGLGTDGTLLYVADSSNNRVLRFDAQALSGAPASDVVGQPSMFSSSFDQGGAAWAGATSHPRGLALSAGELFVADADNNRLLMFTSPPAPGVKPEHVVGQADDATTLPNGGGPIGANTLFGPRGVSATNAWLAVADTRNNRVLIFDRKDLGSAKWALGQPDLKSGARNQSSGPSASTLAAPEGVFIDGDRILVADTGNSRVLIWNHLPTASGAPADVVLGQPDATSGLPNRGASVAGNTLSLPSGVIVARGSVYVADTGNNRVARWPTPSTGATADAILGQSDPSSRAPATMQADLARLASPVCLATDDAFLYVLDRDLGRVVSFTLVDGNGATGTASFGSLGGLGLTSPAGIAVERTPLFTSRMIVADTNASRVVVVGSVSRLR